MDATHISRFLLGLGRVSAQSAILVVLVFGAQWVFRNRLAARWRCALWYLVALRLVMPFSFSSVTSVFNLMPAFPQSGASTPPRMTVQVPRRSTVSRPSTAQVPESSSSVSFEPGSFEIQPPVEPPTPQWPIWIFLAWLGGSIFLIGRIVISSARLRAWCLGFRPVKDTAAIAALEECCERLRVRTKPPLLECDELKSPALHGFLRPRLVLPTGFTTQFSRAELEFVFLHELAHVKRHDLFLNWAMAVLQVVHWFNPLVWLSLSRWRADREIACDAMALEAIGQDRNREYGRTILRLLENFAHPVSAPGFVGILEDKRQLRRRIGMIASYMPARKWSALALLLAAGLAAVGLTDARSISVQNKNSATENQTKGQDMNITNQLARAAGVAWVTTAATTMMAFSESPVLSGKGSNGMTEIRADNSAFNYKEKTFTYSRNVHVDNPQLKLSSESLTIESPDMKEGRFNRVIAGTNVVIDWTDGSGMNHATADQAVYTYILTNLALPPEQRWQTNSTVVLTGNPHVVSGHGTFQGDPIIWDRMNDTISSSNSVDLTITSGKGSSAPVAFSAAPVSETALTGAWILVGTPDHVGKAPSSGGRLKFYAGRSFFATQADPKTGVVIFHHGGNFSVNGNEYVEKVEYANPTTINFIGGTNGHFNMKLDGDTLTLIGKDNPWKEVWKRADKSSAEASPEAKRLIGAWVLVGKPGQVGAPPSEGAGLKIITAGNWCDTQSDPKTGVVVVHHGGTWAFKGTNYVETVRYANPGSMNLIGESFKYNAKVEGDTLTLMGIGNPWQEVWKRVK